MNNTFKFILFGTLIFIVGFSSAWFWIGYTSNTKAEIHNHEINKTDSNQMFTCSMHPQIQQSEEGMCPICGMELVPMQSSFLDSSSEIKLSETAIKLASVHVSEVQKSKAEKVIRVLGEVNIPEENKFAQTSHIPGRIEEWKIKMSGQFIRKGELIAIIYSPDLITAQKELIEAIQFEENAPNLLEAARTKLKSWKLSNELINEIIDSKKVKQELPIYAEQSGYVNQNKVRVGNHVMEGSLLIEIVNLNTLWVDFELFEQDLPWVEVGDKVDIFFNSDPSKTLKATIQFIEPILNQRNRITIARAQIDNKNGDLKPGMNLTGNIKSSIRNMEVISIPKSAVLWTGEQSLVYVQNQKGTYVLRQVQLGLDLGDEYEIKKGLELGEFVVTQGAFTIDAAAQLAGKPSMMNKKEHYHAEHISSKHLDDASFLNSSQQTFEVDSTFKMSMNKILTSYMSLKDALVQTNFERAKKTNTELLTDLNTVRVNLLSDDARYEWNKDEQILISVTNKIERSSSIEEIRGHFSVLSDQLFFTLQKFKTDSHGYRQYCPMAFNNKGAYWLSFENNIINPYFGDMMLTCGELKGEF